MTISGHFDLVLDFKGNTNISLEKNNVCYKFLVDSLYQFEEKSSYPSF